jgi:hypothetical protein
MMLASSESKHVLYTSTLKMEAEMPATESTSIINHYESLKSVN